MAHVAEIHRILRENLHDPTSSFSIGSFGAIAEFHRDSNEPLTQDEADRLTIATGRGALKIDLAEDVKPLAYETLSRRPGRWQHGVVFCLPRDRARSQSRTTITELGPDMNAVRTEDQDAVLFDMGLGARNVDFCIRTQSPKLLDVLRRHEGRSILEPGSQAMGAVIEASPHRIAVSRLGRAEVYQAIGKVKTPEGPHTHVLPKFLRSGRTHSANIPVPRGYLPCLSLYPANPLFDALGRDRPFLPETLASFGRLLSMWGAADYAGEKTRVVSAIAGGDRPESYKTPDTRLARTALRVALRQARQSDPDNPVLLDWCHRFDAPRNTRL